jgi:hypothetical protein
VERVVRVKIVRRPFPDKGIGLTAVSILVFPPGATDFIGWSNVF